MVVRAVVLALAAFALSGCIEFKAPVLGSANPVSPLKAEALLVCATTCYPFKVESSGEGTLRLSPLSQGMKKDYTLQSLQFSRPGGRTDGIILIEMGIRVDGLGTPLTYHPAVGLPLPNGTVQLVLPMCRHVKEDLPEMAGLFEDLSLPCSTRTPSLEKSVYSILEAIPKERVLRAGLTMILHPTSVAEARRLGDFQNKLDAPQSARAPNIELLSRKDYASVFHELATADAGEALLFGSSATGPLYSVTLKASQVQCSPSSRSTRNCTWQQTVDVTPVNAFFSALQDDAPLPKTEKMSMQFSWNETSKQWDSKLTDHYRARAQKAEVPLDLAAAAINGTWTPEQRRQLCRLSIKTGDMKGAIFDAKEVCR